MCFFNLCEGKKRFFKIKVMKEIIKENDVIKLKFLYVKKSIKL